MNKLNANAAYNGTGVTEGRATNLCESMAGPTGSFGATNIVRSTATSNMASADAEKSYSISNFDNKKFVLDHILYEIHMYLWTTKELYKFKTSKNGFKNEIEDETYKDAIYIAQKVSLRNLIEFFCYKGRKETIICYRKFYHLEKSLEPTIKGSSDTTLESYRLFDNDYFDSFFPDIHGYPFWDTNNPAIKTFLDTTILHLTDNRLDWGAGINDNFEYILGLKHIQEGIYGCIKFAIKELLEKIKKPITGKNIYYIYGDEGNKEHKNVTEELRQKRIIDILDAIKKLI